MPYLILVKHSLPDVDPNVPARQWHLSEEGRHRARLLADKLAAYRPAQIVCSVEPKATETAAILAKQLGVPFRQVTGLHEHDRSNEGYRSAEQFQASIATFFQKPNELVFGRETALEAGERFAWAIRSVVDNRPDKGTIVVAHGTVIALLVARHNQVEPFQLWRRLDTPSFVMLSLPAFGLETVVERVDV